MFLGLSLSFLTLTFLKGISHFFVDCLLFWGCLVFPCDLILIVHFCQEYHRRETASHWWCRSYKYGGEAKWTMWYGSGTKDTKDWRACGGKEVYIVLCGMWRVCMLCVRVCACVKCSIPTHQEVLGATTPLSREHPCAGQGVLVLFLAEQTWHLQSLGWCQHQGRESRRSLGHLVPENKDVLQNEGFSLAKPEVMGDLK